MKQCDSKTQGHQKQSQESQTWFRMLVRMRGDGTGDRDWGMGRK